MGKVSMKRTGANDLHYENKTYHKERECNNLTTHEVGKSGSIRTRSRSRVTSTVRSGGSPSKSHRSHSKSHRSPSKSHRSPSRSHHSPKARSMSAGGGSRHEVSRRGSGEHRSRRSSASGKSKRGPKRDNQTITGREKCYDQPARRMPDPCTKKPTWQHGKYVRDDCGSGIVPKRFDFRPSRKIWCKTPLTMYQATIGELARKILCREKIVPRDVKPGPPCNVCEYILPPCRGYYRKYDCLRPCEEEYVSYKHGKKTYRNRVERYWEPCLTKDQKQALDINTYAGHNSYLGIKLRRKNVDIPCW